METLTLSQSIFDQKAKEAIDLQPMRRQISMHEVELLSMEKVRVQGAELILSKQAFTDYIEILRLPKAFLNRFKEVFGEENQKVFINRLRESASLVKGLEVTLVANPQKQTIVRILGPNRAMISNDSALDFAKRYIDGYDLGVNSFFVETNGAFSINTTSPAGFHSIHGLKDESFQAGVTFHNSPERGLEVSPYIHRLICANGMVGRQMDESYRLTNLSPEAIEKFNEQILQLQQVNFAPSGFADRIHKAVNTNASIFEMQSAFGGILSKSKGDYDRLQKWIPLDWTLKKYAEMGHDPNKFTKVQRQNAQTNMSVNDLYNAVTNFATHDHKGIEIKDYDRNVLMIQAGNLLWKRNYDIENFIPSPFMN
jgi:hypothetical protein